MMSTWKDDCVGRFSKTVAEHESLKTCIAQFLRFPFVFIPVVTITTLFKRAEVRAGNQQFSSSAITLLSDQVMSSVHSAKKVLRAISKVQSLLMRRYFSIALMISFVVLLETTLTEDAQWRRSADSAVRKRTRRFFGAGLGWQSGLFGWPYGYGGFGFGWPWGYGYGWPYGFGR
uniref:Uncharacterized protein n=1 Tax=Ascaris lumbricoides TaxID=6252 RepID=A0A9J2PZD3_ASCLU